MIRYCRAIAVLTIVILVAGCGNPVRKKVESSIEKALPGIIGPAKSYDVKVSGHALSIVKGKLETMEIVGRDVQLAKGINLAELRVLSKNIYFDTEKRVISSVDSTDYSATLSGGVLNKYLRKSYPQVPELAVELRNGDMCVSAAPSVVGLQARIAADAKLKVRDCRYLILDLQRITVAGIGTPAFAREYLETRANPVFDAESIGYDAKLNSAVIRQAGITIQGTLDLTKK